MKKIIIFILIFANLSAYADFLEIFKVPEVFTHYYFHKKENKDLSFIDFLELHYGDLRNIHHEEDTKLPFKSTHHNCLASHSGVMIPPKNLTIISKTTSITEEEDSNFSSIESFYLMPYLNAIWQPPRV